MNESQLNSVDQGAVFWGFWLGLVIGGIIALLKAPTRGKLSLIEIGQNMRQTVLPKDHVAQSMAEGKAAARKRLQKDFS